MDENEPKPWTKNSEAKRISALRNHKIRFDDVIDLNAERVPEARKTDVLFGRGRGYQDYPGNVRMREMLEDYKVQYHLLNRTDKRKLVTNIYKKMIADGVRFLKSLQIDGENVWVKVDAPVAIQKVSHTLRCRKSFESLKLKVGENTVTTSTGGPGDIEGPGNDIDDTSSIEDVTPERETSARNWVMPSTSVAVAGDDGLLMAEANPFREGGVVPSLPSPTLLSAFASYPASSTDLGLLEPTSSVADLEMAELEAQHMAARNRYATLLRSKGVPTAPGMLPGMPQGPLAPNVDYLSLIRRQKLMRETMMLQQMGDACLLDHTRTSISMAALEAKHNAALNRYKTLASMQANNAGMLLGGQSEVGESEE